MGNFRNLIRAGALALPLLLTACTGEQPEAAQITFGVISGVGNNAFDGSGIVYPRGSILHYYDLESGNDTVLCARPNCKHEAPSSKNPDAECDAYYSGMAVWPFLYGGDLYVLHCPEERSFDEWVLCRADPAGTNRRTIAEIRGMDTVTEICMEDGVLFLGYRKSYEMEGEEPGRLDKDICGIYTVDLSSGKVAALLEKEEYSGMVTNICPGDGTVTYVLTYQTENILKEYIQAIQESDDPSEVISAMAVRMDEVTVRRILQYDWNTGEERELWAGREIILDIEKNGYASVQDQSRNVSMLRLADQTLYPLGEKLTGMEKRGMVIANGGTADNSFRYNFYEFATGEVSGLICLPDCSFCSINAITHTKVFLTYVYEDVWWEGWVDEEDFYAGKVDSVDKVHNMGEVSDFY